MAFELFTYSGRTPRRLYTVLRTVLLLESPSRTLVMELLQPFADDRGTSRDLIGAAIGCGLLEHDVDTDLLRLRIEPNDIQDFETFRRIMQKIVLGHAEPQDDFFIQNQFAAWYIVQNERIFRYDKPQLASQFQLELYPHDQRAMNETKLNGWLTWASFLGWGWSYKRGRGQILMPDATYRLLPIVPSILQANVTLPFGDFILALAKACPELDGGQLFTQCWQASRSSEARGNRVSLMLSNALRVLADQGLIELQSLRDVSETWQLYEAKGYQNEVTHIGLGGSIQ